MKKRERGQHQARKRVWDLKDRPREIMEFSHDLLLILIFLGIGMIGMHLFLDPTMRRRRDRKKRKRYYDKEGEI